MADILIRPAQRDEADRISQLWSRLVQYHHVLDDKLPQEAEEGRARYAWQVREQIADAYSQVLVAVADQQVIGFTIGIVADLLPHTFQAETTGFLADIFVDPAYRQQGIGRRLVRSLGAWFKTRGVHQMEWYVAARNTTGRAFWQSLGGRDVMIRMRLEL
jgi:GNAT superfamily N-acetyltransferase